MEQGIEALQPCFAALIDVALAVCLGGLLLRAFLPGAALARVFHVGLTAMAVGLSGFLWSGAASMSGTEGAAVWQALPVVLTQTSFGHAMLAACVAWCVFAAAFAMRRRVAFWSSAAWCALAFVCVARAATGHAMDAGWGSYAIWVHAVHIAAGAVWAGTVFVATGLAQSWRNWAVPQRLEVAHKISHTATLALASVAASGVVNAWRTLGESGIALSDPYTALLALKLACVGLAVCMGAYNRWRVMPFLMEKGVARRFAAVLLVEGLVLLVAMLLAARLGATMPPM